jgi:hypothetical protein
MEQKLHDSVLQDRQDILNRVDPDHVFDRYADPMEHIVKKLNETQEAIAKNLNHYCPMCFSILTDPVETNCGHLACKECYKTFLKHLLKGRRLLTCWVCRANIRVEDIRSSLAINRQIRSCEYYTTNCVPCGKMGMKTLIDAMDHFLECKETYKICSCDNKKRILSEHEEHMLEHARVSVRSIDRLNSVYRYSCSIWNIRLAVRCITLGKNEEGLSILEENKENPYAATILAHLYSKGIGTPKDERRAYELYTSAVIKKHYRAMYYLAHMYSKDNDICGKNISRVLDLLFESAWNGERLSQYSLGMVYELGIWVPLDLNVSIHYLELAAKQRHPVALKKIIDYYERENGTGPLKDIPVEERNKRIRIYKSDLVICEQLNEGLSSVVDGNNPNVIGVPMVDLPN